MEALNGWGGVITASLTIKHEEHEIRLDHLRT